MISIQAGAMGYHHIYAAGFSTASTFYNLGPALFGRGNEGWEV
jgi:hypothetical protein